MRHCSTKQYFCGLQWFLTLGHKQCSWDIVNTQAICLKSTCPVSIWPGIHGMHISRNTSIQTWADTVCNRERAHKQNGHFGQTDIQCTHGQVHTLYTCKPAHHTIHIDICRHTMEYTYGQATHVNSIYNIVKCNWLGKLLYVRQLGIRNFLVLWQESDGNSTGAAAFQVLWLRLLLINCLQALLWDFTDKLSC